MTTRIVPMTCLAFSVLLAASSDLEPSCALASSSQTAKKKRFGFGSHAARFSSQFDRMGRWGGWGRNIFGAHRMGKSGGWARPMHRFRWFGWGGWGVPYYAAGPGYGYLDYDHGDTIDAEGSIYNGRSYTFPELTGSGSKQSVVSGSVKKTRSRFRLGPDADILDGGRVVIYLTRYNYMWVTSNCTRVFEKKSGRLCMELTTDPVLLWHIASELKHQTLGLKTALLCKKAENDAKEYELKKGLIGAAEDTRLEHKVSHDVETASRAENGETPRESLRLSDEQIARDKAEIKNLERCISLLELAASRLGKIPGSFPDSINPPEVDSMELIASVWVTRDGQFVIYKKADGALVYMDGKGIYSDNKKTPLQTEYPKYFQQSIYEYLGKLVKDGQPTITKLKEDQKNAQRALQELDSRLKKGLRFKPDERESKRRLRKEQTRRVIQAILRTEARLKAIDAQLQSMPGELSICENALKSIVDFQFEMDPTF